MVSDMLDRTDPIQLKEHLRSLDIWSKKRLGQHFLIDSKVLDQIIQASAVGSNDTVVEIGPGPGVLTERLLSRVKRLIAFEFDPHMLRLLRADFPNLELIEGDILQTAHQEIPELDSYHIVANIPYQITTPLLKLFLEGGIEPRPLSMTLLVQKEVGKRLTAGARQPNRGYLSVLCQYFAEMTYVTTVLKTAFWPAPEVDSAVLHFKLRPTRAFSGEQEKEFLRFVRSRFIQPRKQLKNVIAGIQGVEQTEVVPYLLSLGLKESVRAQELSQEEWQKLYLQPFNPL